MAQEDVLKALEEAVNKPKFSTCQAILGFVNRAKETLDKNKTKIKPTMVLPSGPAPGGGGAGSGSIGMSGGNRH